MHSFNTAKIWKSLYTSHPIFMCHLLGDLIVRGRRTHLQTPQGGRCGGDRSSRPILGEAVTAVVVPRLEETIEEEEIIKLCKINFAGYKAPKRVFVTNEIPKNPSGKILKRDLKVRYK